MLNKLFARRDFSKIKPSFPAICAGLKLMFGGAPKRITQEPDFTSLDVGKEYSFQGHYNQYLRPQVEQFEEGRLDRLYDLRMRLWVSLIVMVCVIGFAVTFVLTIEAQSVAQPYRKWLGNAFDIYMFLVFMGGTALLFWMVAPSIEYRSRVKEDIFPYLFQYFQLSGQGEFHYQEEPPVSMDDYEESGIIPYFNVEHLEDYVRGRYKSVGMEMLEAKLLRVTQHGSKRSTQTVFRGIMIQLEMNKPFHGHTILKRDYGKLGNLLAHSFGTDGKERVALEDPIFEKQFEVFSTDQVEARYLLNTAFMERLLALSELLESKSIQAAFYQNHLLLMISSKHDRFEAASIFEPATFEHEIMTIMEEMQQLFGIVDTLKLHEQTRL